MEIAPNARRHGVSDDDIRHATDNAMASIDRPRDLSDAEAQAIVDAFDDHDDDELQVVPSGILSELRAAAAAKREAEGRVEAAARAARRAGASWGVIGAQLGITRQGARQRFERLVD